MFIFNMNGDAALIFFEAVRDLEKWLGRKATEEERTMILTEMAAMGYVDSVVETKRTKEEVIKDATRNFGDVLHFKEDGTTEIIKPEDKDGD